MRRAAEVFMLLIAVSSVAAACSSGSGLTGKAWQWTASTTTSPASQSVVPDPANYTVEFKSDGTFSSKADCNTVKGSYTTTSPNGLAITPGPATLVACPPGSQGSAFIAGLSSSVSYAIANSQLTITTTDGTMTFK